MINQKDEAKNPQIRERLGHSLWSVDGHHGYSRRTAGILDGHLNAMDEYSEGISV